MSKTYAVAYARVSTTEQATTGHGLDAQADAITELCKRHHLTLLNGVLRDEGADGDLPAQDRPALAEALALITNGHATALIVANLDRMDRTLTGQEATLALVWSHGGEVYAAANYGGEVPRDDPDDPYKTAMRQMHGVFSQLEKGVLKARMRAGKRAKAARGGYTGGRPGFGYVARDRELVQVPTEQAVIIQARRKRTQGWTLQRIADWLNHETAHRPRGGGDWTRTAVYRLLRDEEVAA